MKLGVLSFAHMHAESYVAAVGQMEDVTLRVVADDNQERGQAMARILGVPYVHDYQEALSQYALDAVIITSENARHKEMAVAAAEAGVHVLCEKPLATSVEDGEQMVQAARAHGTLLQMAFPMRFSGPVKRVKQQVDSGEIGMVVAINGTNRGKNPGGWFVEPQLSGGGAVMDHTVHVVDLMRWVTGSEVKEVYAEVGTRFDALATDDAGLLIMEFENGVIAAHDPSWSRPRQSFPTWGDVTLEVVGTEGVTRADAFGQHLVHYDERAGKASHRGFGDDPDHLMLTSFVDAVRTGKSEMASGMDGLRATEVALAAYESARLRRPVRLR